jgi:hypothetical protein
MYSDIVRKSRGFQHKLLLAAYIFRFGDKLRIAVNLAKMLNSL